MIQVFIDSDVILDVLAERQPFFKHSAHVLSLSEQNKVAGCTTALVFANVHYLLKKHRSKPFAESQLRKLRIILDIIPLTEKHVDMSLNSGFNDFEDALQNFSAEGSGTTCILTRNKQDYRQSRLSVLTPEEFLTLHNYI